MQEHRLERLLEVGRTIVSELELDALLEHILEVARELTGARYAAVGVLDEHRRHLSRFLTSGIDAETKARIGDLPRGRGVLGMLISDPQPLRLDDVGSHPESYGFPVGHPPMSSFLGVPILVRGHAWGNLYLTEKRSGGFTDEDEETALILADWAAVAIGNARAYGEEQRRRRELERGVAAYEATHEIAKALAGETDLDVVLELVVKRGRALVAARAMFIGLLDRDEIAVVTAAGRLDRAIIGQRVPRDGSLTGRVMRLRRSQRLSDLDATTTFTLERYVRAQAGLFVPLLLRGRAIGVLAAFDRLEDGPEFGPEDERLMEAFAASAANAVATAQTVAAEGLQRAMHAAEEERRRWARELHDETLQDIGALRVLLGGARQGNDPDHLAAAVDHAVERLADQANVLRALITDLHPAALDKLGVAAAVDALVERARRATDLDITVTTDLAFEHGREPRRLAPQTELAVYRAIQEALTNVMRHAGASRVEIEIRETPEAVTARVSDDGCGFDVAEDASGFGLVGMRERVTLVDGEVSVVSRRGAGTTVRVTVPVTRAQAPPAAPVVGRTAS
jgi:signal transduction histidine kinase